MADDDWMRDVRVITESTRRKHELDEGAEALSRVGDDLDARVNFRVNSVLKAEFESVCKRNHTTISREIKRFMTESVRTQKLF